MVYFTYSQVAFVTLLAFAAINSGESLNPTVINERLNKIEAKIKEVISELKPAEGRVQSLTAKILSQNASLRGEIENYTDCLETAYKNKWGEFTFTEIIKHLKIQYGETLGEVLECSKQGASEYLEKKTASPVDKCLEKLPSANRKDLQQLQVEIEGVFYHNGWFSVAVFFKKLYKNQLKMLRGN
ncbi:unnamed protein product [Trichobilharzia szidati]|nr:unnamed protein product [Trichobilharzia szidati]